MKCFFKLKKKLQAEYKSISIDVELENGQTALLAAAEENAGAYNHTFLINDDGRPVLAVAFLLDRNVYRPDVNQENKFGHTPLMRAAANGRPHTMQALIDRGADVNKINKFNQTALHFAALVRYSRLYMLLFIFIG
jgi:ankyrin repeat protein